MPMIYSSVYRLFFIAVLPLRLRENSSFPWLSFSGAGHRFEVSGCRGTTHPTLGGKCLRLYILRISHWRSIVCEDFCAKLLILNKRGKGRGLTNWQYPPKMGKQR